VLPTSSWGAVITEQDHEIRPAVSFVCVGKHNEDARMVILKQVFIDEQLLVKVYAFHSTVTPAMLDLNNFTIQSLQDVEMIIKSLHDRHLCVGGPPKHNQYPLPENSYTDSRGSWRHYSCELLVTANGRPCLRLGRSNCQGIM